MVVGEYQWNMPDYDFKTLSPPDFEILSRDLIQKELGIRLESFKSGKDQGIDFRHSSDRDKKLIIQCKHYAESTFSDLFKNLKRDELKKVAKLAPERYILITSLGLTPKQKDDIFKIFDPFIKNTKDIYTKDDLNNLLGIYQDIEKKHFKLWMHNISILEGVINKKIINCSLIR